MATPNRLRLITIGLYAIILVSGCIAVAGVTLFAVSGRSTMFAAGPDLPERHRTIGRIIWVAVIAQGRIVAIGAPRALIADSGESLEDTILRLTAQ